MNKEQIALVIVGGVLGLIALGVAVVFWWCECR